jgi:methylglutaconyl-CoA hydratase
VHAPAFGGGLELALATTLRVFTANVEVGLPETRLAILPGAGGTYRLPAAIGLQRARDLVLTGRRVKAPEAYFLGLCDRLVDGPLPKDPQGKFSAEELAAAREKCLEAGVELARQICEGGPIAVRLALRAVNGWEEGLDGSVENKAYEGVVTTRDRDEALAAFREKRKPVFEGR